jgi:probable rRNA maturation factor
MPKKSRPEIRLTIRGGPFVGVGRAVIRRRAEKMLQHLDLSAVELSVALVDDEAMRQLNRTYRGKNRPTDVLAFAMREGDNARFEEDAELLGDVVISVPTAARQAGRRRPLLDELTMLLAHGLLHLLGYDHDTKAKERVMVAKTRELEAAAIQRSGNPR